MPEIKNQFTGGKMNKDLDERLVPKGEYRDAMNIQVSTSTYGQQLVPRLIKEKFAAIRKAKLRLSNLKLEELTQILRGKSKQIKH